MALDPGAPACSSTIDVAAPPAAVYALVTDLDAMAGIAEETESMRWVSGSADVAGSVFKGANRNGRHRWTTSCRVSDAEPDRLFAFEVSVARIPVSQWAYVLEPLPDGGCRVTESAWDRRPGWFRKPAGLATGLMDRQGGNQRHIDATLVRLKAHLESA